MINENYFYRDMSTTIIAKRLFEDYCKAKNNLSRFKIFAVGPEGFAESWTKKKLDGAALQDEVISKFTQLLYDLGNGKKNNKKKAK